MTRRQDSRSGATVPIEIAVGRPGWRTPLVVILAWLFALLGAATAWAHGGEETTVGYVLVQQALGHLAHDTSAAGIDLAMEKADDALDTPDNEGVDIAKVQQARAALEANQVARAQELLTQAITAAVAAQPPATGMSTGTRTIEPELAGRPAAADVGWVPAIASLALLLAGAYLTYRYRPADTPAQLRRRLAQTADGDTQGSRQEMP